jgi:hypothetical protein
VAVEKLARHEFAEIASRQEALQMIFPSLLDIFYHPIFDFFQKNRLFQQLPLLLTLIRTFIEDARDGAWPQKKTVLPVRAFVVDMSWRRGHHPRTRIQGVSARLRLVVEQTQLLLLHPARR